MNTHPKGLYTLFLTEMWERFSFYGMRALLVLFMTHEIQRGGLGFTSKMANAIYGLYTAAVYLASLPGGWFADRLLGAQKAVLYGGIIIAAGHFTMAIPLTRTFFLGLILVVIGTGLLKPNISAIVGGLYPEGGTRRDAGFTLFYMGINLGAFLGPLVCGPLGERVDWHYGFGAAGVGMVLGLLQYQLSRKHLGPAGLQPGNPSKLSSFARSVLVCAIIAAVVVVGLGLAGLLRIDPIAVAQQTTGVIVAVAGVYFVIVLFFSGLDAAEKRRVSVILILFVSSAVFWAGFEQVGSSFNLFAERHTLRTMAWLNAALPSRWHNLEIPTSTFQSVGPIFIILLAPVMASLWVRLARRHLDPSIPAKFGLGLILLGVGFLVMAGAAMVVAAGHKVWPTWLLTTYLLHTFGELCLSPVGLSSVTKLAPARFVGQMMGIWFLATSLGNLIAGLLAGQFDEDALNQWPSLYLSIALLPSLAGLLLLFLSKPIKNWVKT